MLRLTPVEREKSLKLDQLKARSGSHSPSVHVLLKELGLPRVKIDACYLSNPYATDLFLEYLRKEVLETDRLKQIIEYYPSQNETLAQRLGDHLQVDPSTLFVANGGVEVIQAVIQNYGGKNIVICLPTFSSYYEFATPNQSVHFFHLKKEDEFRIQWADYFEFVERVRPDTIILINPNNPDGGYIPRSELEGHLARLSWVKNIIIDESFIHFASEGDGGIPHHHSLVDTFPNLIIVKSMSKDFGIAGLRLGYGVMSPLLVSKLLKSGYLWNINGFSEYFLEVLVRKSFWAEYLSVRKLYVDFTREFFQKIKTLPLFKSYPTESNFVLMETLDGTTVDVITAKLLFSHGIYIRNCSDKLGLKGNFLRISSRTESENAELFRTFEGLSQQSMDGLSSELTLAV